MTETTTATGTTTSTTTGTTGGAAERGGTTDDVRWLTDDEQRVWRLLLPVLHDLPAALDRQLQADAGLPHAYYVILAMLSEAPGHELRMTELAARTSTSLSRLSHAVARLEEQGWVHRRRCPTDRRGQIAGLTDAGFATVVATAPGHVAQVRRVLFDALTPEQVGRFEEILTAIGDAVRTTCPGPDAAG